MSLLSTFPVHSDEPEVYCVLLAVEGQGAAAPTVSAGPIDSIARQGIGDYTITLKENPGTFLYALGTDAADGKTYVDSAGTVRNAVGMHSATTPFSWSGATLTIDAAAEYAASTYYAALFFFKRHNV